MGSTSPSVTEPAAAGNFAQYAQLAEAIAIAEANQRQLQHQLEDQIDDHRPGAYGGYYGLQNLNFWKIKAIKIAPDAYKFTKKNIVPVAGDVWRQAYPDSYKQVAVPYGGIIEKHAGLQNLMSDEELLAMSDEEYLAMLDEEIRSLLDFTDYSQLQNLNSWEDKMNSANKAVN